MPSPINCLLRAGRHVSKTPLLRSNYQIRSLSTIPSLCKSHNLHDPPKGQSTRSPGREPPGAPEAETEHLKTDKSSTFLGTTKRLPEFNLLDRVILVSGGARGLGLTQAEGLLEAGATVCALDRLPEPSPDFYRVQKRAAEELGTTLLYRQIDVRDEDLLQDVVAKIGDEHGRMDGLIAAAGIQQETPALEYTAKDANLMFEINITGTFMTCKAVAKQMIKAKNGGSIAMIASMSGSVANRVSTFPTQSSSFHLLGACTNVCTQNLICPAYNASKAGVIQLARNLASEWGQYGIRVNTISPGYIVTAMTEELFKLYPERRTDWPNQNMLGKLSRPEDFRGAAVFLMSEASAYMTGADMRIDGGHSAW